MHAMGQGFDMEYKPNPAVTAIYNMRYKNYIALGKSLEK
jgi:L-ribulokinase